MAAATFKREFHRPSPGDARLPEVARFSPEREPWRVFRSSLAVQFTSERTPNWSAADISQASRHEIIAALEARMSIVRSYSSINSGLWDLVDKARSSGDYAKLCVRAGSGSSELLAAMRRLLAVHGPLSSQGTTLSEWVSRIEALGDRLEPVIHGFAEVREEKSGEIRFWFELGRRRQALTHDQLEAEAEALQNFASEAAHRFANCADAL